MIGERKRLAREIHDTLIQGFASIVVNLGKPPRARSGRSRTPYAHHLEAGRDARDGLSEARRIVWALRPGALDGAPAGRPLAARGTVVQGDRRRGGRGRHGEAMPLSTEAEATLLRVAQKALNNVGKHARAGRTVLTLLHGDHVALDVTDDGVGFGLEGDSPQAGPDGRFGLGAMRERVEGVGGTLLVESEPGGGTTLAVGLPVAERGSKVLEETP